MPATEPLFGVEIGTVNLATHPRSRCEGRGIPCCIHEPSDHHMRDWPMLWRADTGVMERTCPHGVGHPDPDHMAYVRSLTPKHECENSWGYWSNDEKDGECPYPHFEWQGTHSCDGCCQAPGSP